MKNYILLFSVFVLALASCTKETPTTTDSAEDVLLSTRSVDCPNHIPFFADLCTFWEPLAYGGPGNSSCGYDAPSGSCCQLFATLPGSVYTVTSYGCGGAVNTIEITADETTGCIEICPSVENAFLMHVEMIDPGNIESISCVQDVKKLFALLETGGMTCDLDCSAPINSLTCFISNIETSFSSEECCYFLTGYPGMSYTFEYDNGTVLTIEADENGKFTVCVKRGERVNIILTALGPLAQILPEHLIDIILANLGASMELGCA